SSEFELSIDEPSDSSSEFELSLDEEGDIGLKKVTEDSSSSSEFELTLDEEGGLSSSVDSGVLESDEKDIFEETNFDVPALDESGSQVAAVESDTDLEDSNFEISMDEDSETGEDSQVVDTGEDADEGAATVARPRKGKGKGKGQAMVEVEEEEGELDLDLDRSSGARKRPQKRLDEEVEV